MVASFINLGHQSAGLLLNDGFIYLLPSRHLCAGCAGRKQRKCRNGKRIAPLFLCTGWEMADLGETSDGLLADGGIILQGQAVGPECFHHFLDAGACLHLDLAAHRVHRQDFV